MELPQRIKAFVDLGLYLNSGNYNPDYSKIAANNPWFTRLSVDKALTHISSWLQPDLLWHWVQSYNLPSGQPKRVGLIMAGNIPLVGFHDMLCTLITGNLAWIKPSHQDAVLIKDLIDILIDVQPSMNNLIRAGKELHQNDIDLLIATGSDNSARYFEYNYRSTPSLVRKNRTSHAVVSGSESDESWHLLSNDLFDYYGKGCRSVSKLWLPHGFKVSELVHYLKPTNLDLPSYLNNYHYQKALLSMQGVSFIEGANYLLVEHTDQVSPIGVVHYQYYDDVRGLADQLARYDQKLQAVYAEDAWYPKSTAWGLAQAPDLADYADQADTIKFILEN